MYNTTIKRTLDLILSITLILILMPLIIILAVAIKVNSKGPIIFKQERLGLRGNVFNIYKFRTMINNAMSEGTGLSTHEGDYRVTKVGSLLRKTSLDEIPQLLNVIKGEMSIIGPRPPVPYHPRKFKEYSKQERKRFDVRPGITGYAQIKGRNSLKWDERIVIDIEYVKKQSLKLDIKILLLTFVKVFKIEDIHGPERKKRNQ